MIGRMGDFLLRGGSMEETSSENLGWHLIPGHASGGVRYGQKK